MNIFVMKIRAEGGRSSAWNWWLKPKPDIPLIYAKYDKCSSYKDIHLCLIYYICHIYLI